MAFDRLAAQAGISGAAPSIERSTAGVASAVQSDVEAIRRSGITPQTKSATAELNFSQKPEHADAVKAYKSLSEALTMIRESGDGLQVNSKPVADKVGAASRFTNKVETECRLIVGKAEIRPFQYSFHMPDGGAVDYVDVPAKLNDIKAEFGEDVANAMQTLALQRIVLGGLQSQPRTVDMLDRRTAIRSLNGLLGLYRQRFETEGIIESPKA